MQELQECFPDFAKNYLTDNGFDLVLKLKGKKGRKLGEFLAKTDASKMIRLFTKFIPSNSLSDVLSQEADPIDNYYYLLCLMMAVFS